MFLACIEVKIYREKSGTSETGESSRFEVQSSRFSERRT